MWRRRPPPPQPSGPGAGDFPPPSPGATVYAVGDIHGRADLLETMLRMIEADDTAEGGASEIVFLGDYVDRGPASRDVLERLAGLAAGAGRPVSCLMGNHEAMMLDFLDGTGDGGHLWLDNGGIATLHSFGVDGLEAERDGAAMAHGKAALAGAIGPDLLGWIRALPRRVQRGNVHFVHAGARSDAPMEAQDPEVLIWARPTARTAPRDDGQWVVHGHTIVAGPFVAPGRVNIDTGAVQSGRLTALRLEPGGWRFLST